MPTPSLNRLKDQDSDTGISMLPNQGYRSVSVAIFAYNEQAAIAETVRSIMVAAENAFQHDEIQVHVLANGCTDNTHSIVQVLSDEDPRIQLQNLTVGDKAATWNSYVHEIADLSCPHHLHVFMDGDVAATERVLVNVVDALNAQPDSPACSVLPAIGFGRSRELNVQLFEQDGALFGNLYALTTKFMTKIRESGIRIPVGSVGDDALVTEMIALDLDRRNEYDPTRIVRAADPEGFTYEPLSPFRLADLHLYLHRRIRYQIRTWQLALCQQLNFCDLPGNVREFDEQILESLSKKRIWNPIELLARRRIRKRGTVSYSKS